MSSPTVTASVPRRVVREATMTCDLPVIDPVRVCRPTGRPERREVGVRRAAVVHSGDRVVRTADRSRTTVRSFDRRRIGGLLVAGLLAAMAWLVLMIGDGAYDGAHDGAVPVTPTATSVVYVRSGESLSSLAERIAPDLPVDGVIAQVRELNGLETSGLVVGQPLIVPNYR